jgi:hypothetical protein
MSFSLALFPCASWAQKVDPCALLTQAEIQEILGKPVQPGTMKTSANAAIGFPCQYVVGDYGAFSVLVKTAGIAETPDKMMAELNKMNIKTEVVAGIGDKSFFAFPGYGMVQINSFKGSRYAIMTLLVPGFSEQQNKDAAAKLMKKALPKI